MTNA
jgi:NTE family protein